MKTDPAIISIPVLKTPTSERIEEWRKALRARPDLDPAATYPKLASLHFQMMCPDVNDMNTNLDYESSIRLKCPACNWTGSNIEECTEHASAVHSDTLEEVSMEQASG